MTISKLTVLLFAFAMGVVSMGARAEDNATATVKPANPPAAAPSATAGCALCAAAQMPIPMGPGNWAGNGPGRLPLVAPALPFNKAKADQLWSLLQLYRADRLSPAEYHRQRAALLAQP